MPITRSTSAISTEEGKGPKSAPASNSSGKACALHWKERCKGLYYQCRCPPRPTLPLRVRTHQVDARRLPFQVVVLDDEKVTPETEFTEDLLAFVASLSTSFSDVRQYCQASLQEVEEGSDQGGRSRGSSKTRQAGKDAQDADAVDQALEEAAKRVDGQCEVHVQQMPRGRKKRKLSAAAGLAQTMVRE